MDPKDEHVLFPGQGWMRREVFERELATYSLYGRWWIYAQMAWRRTELRWDLLEANKVWAP